MPTEPSNPVNASRLCSRSRAVCDDHEAVLRGGGILVRLPRRARFSRDQCTQVTPLRGDKSRSLAPWKESSAELPCCRIRTRQQAKNACSSAPCKAHQDSQRGSERRRG